MLSKKLEKALNDQVNMEIYSFYVYLSIAAYLDTLHLDGFSHWMRLQADEEMEHAMKLFDYILERDGEVTLAGIKAPAKTWRSALGGAEAALKHERANTKKINGLMDMAVAEKDHASQVFLQWFVGEQVEEEATASKIVEKLKLIGKDQGALFFLDQELSKRAGSGGGEVDAT